MIARLKKKSFPIQSKSHQTPPTHSQNKTKCIQQWTMSSVPDNHEYGNSLCKISIFIHNRITSKLLKSIIKHNPKNPNWTLSTWYTQTLQNSHLNSNYISSFPKKWGDIGIIPKNINKMITRLKINNFNTFLKEMISIIHFHIAANLNFLHYTTKT